MRKISLLLLLVSLILTITGCGNKANTNTNESEVKVPLYDYTDWYPYEDKDLKFEFKYPLGSSYFDAQTPRINLPMEAKTNLIEKFILVEKYSEANCKIAYDAPTTIEPEIIDINGVTFQKRINSQKPDKKNTYDVINYRTTMNSQCVNLTLVMHSTDLNSAPKGSDYYNYGQESEMITKIINSFKKL